MDKKEMLEGLEVSGDNFVFMPPESIKRGSEKEVLIC